MAKRKINPATGRPYPAQASGLTPPKPKPQLGTRSSSQAFDFAQRQGTEQVTNTVGGVPQTTTRAIATAGTRPLTAPAAPTGDRTQTAAQAAAKRAGSTTLQSLQEQLRAKRAAGTTQAQTQPISPSAQAHIDARNQKQEQSALEQMRQQLQQAQKTAAEREQLIRGFGVETGEIKKSLTGGFESLGQQIGGIGQQQPFQIGQQAPFQVGAGGVSDEFQPMADALGQQQAAAGQILGIETAGAQRVSQMKQQLSDMKSAMLQEQGQFEGGVPVGISEAEKGRLGESKEAIQAFAERRKAIETQEAEIRNLELQEDFARNIRRQESRNRKREDRNRVASSLFSAGYSSAQVNLLNDIDIENDELISDIEREKSRSQGKYALELERIAFNFDAQIAESEQMYQQQVSDSYNDLKKNWMALQESTTLDYTQTLKELDKAKTDYLDNVYGKDSVTSNYAELLSGFNERTRDYAMDVRRQEFAESKFERTQSLAERKEGRLGAGSGGGGTGSASRQDELLYLSVQDETTGEIDPGMFEGLSSAEQKSALRGEQSFMTGAEGALQGRRAEVTAATRRIQQTMETNPSMTSQQATAIVENSGEFPGMNFAEIRGSLEPPTEKKFTFIQRVLALDMPIKNRASQELFGKPFRELDGDQRVQAEERATELLNQ